MLPRIDRVLQTFCTTLQSTAASLTQLLKLGAFKWTKETDEAFQKLQDTMMTLPVLALHDFNIPFEVETDAFRYGIRVVLMQNKRPIAFYSHTLAMRDRAKPVYERANSCSISSAMLETLSLG